MLFVVLYEPLLSLFFTNHFSLFFTNHFSQFSVLVLINFTFRFFFSLTDLSECSFHLTPVFTFQNFSLRFHNLFTIFCISRNLPNFNLSQSIQKRTSPHVGVFRCSRQIKLPTLIRKMNFNNQKNNCFRKYKRCFTRKIFT